MTLLDLQGFVIVTVNRILQTIDANFANYLFKLRSRYL